MSRPPTWYTRLIYGEAGLHSEVFRYGEEEEALLNEMDVLSARQIALCRDADTKASMEAVETSQMGTSWMRFVRAAAPKLCGRFPPRPPWTRRGMQESHHSEDGSFLHQSSGGKGSVRRADGRTGH